MSVYYWCQICGLYIRMEDRATWYTGAGWHRECAFGFVELVRRSVEQRAPDGGQFVRLLLQALHLDGSAENPPEISSDED